MAKHVRSAFAEAAMRIVRTGFSDFTVGLPTVAPVGRIRTGVTALGSADRDQVRLQACFMRMVAGAEAFTDAMLLGLLDREAALATVVLSRILADYTVDVTNTWHARRSALSRDFGIVIGSWTLDARLVAAIEVRNTIAHGLGRMTRRQLRNAASLQRVESFGVHVEAGVLQLNVTNIQDGRDLCLGYIDWLDESADLVPVP